MIGKPETAVIRIGGSSNQPADSTDYYNSILRQPDYKDVIGRDILLGDSIAFGIDSVTAALHFPDHLFVLYKNGKVPPEYVRRHPSNAQAMLSHIFLLHNEPVAIQANGMFYDPANMVSSGYWGWSEKMAGMLPFDYYPNE